MQKVKDGYRATFRLNVDNPEHLEIYQMFQEIIKSDKHRNESDLYRAGIASLYREKQGNGISDERIAELQECARISVNEVREMVQEIINIAIADLKTSAIRVAPADSDIPPKSMENMGMKPPKSSEVLPDDICDFMEMLV